jgi:hypothetical protein
VAIGRMDTSKFAVHRYEPRPWEWKQEDHIGGQSRVSFQAWKRSILDGLPADTSVQSVRVLARRKPRVAQARLTCHIVDFAALSPLPPVDGVYLALGTIIKVAGSQAAFRAVDFDANLAAVRAALAAGARRCGPVSAQSPEYSITG